MKSTIAKTVAIASLVGVGATACTSNPFMAKPVANSDAAKMTQANCGANKTMQASCGASKNMSASCGSNKKVEGGCGANH